MIIKYYTRIKNNFRNKYYYDVKYVKNNVERVFSAVISKFDGTYLFFDEDGKMLDIVDQFTYGLDNYRRPKKTKSVSNCNH